MVVKQESLIDERDALLKNAREARQLLQEERERADKRLADYDQELTFLRSKIERCDSGFNACLLMNAKTTTLFVLSCPDLAKKVGLSTDPEKEQ
ncbi:MAG TPA: hypothetical protein VFT74_19145 [Isosphaeraceae bacterium]|nr:hypothetical protein [Isosphaeraceae bacterium]